MDSQQIQYIIVYIILAVIIGWVLYTLLRKKPEHKNNCHGCSLSASCRKKKMFEERNERPTSCGDCPETENCDKKSDLLGCGGNGDGHRTE